MITSQSRASLTTPDFQRCPVFIYALAEPGTMTVRYVGKSYDPKSRLSTHLSAHAPYRVRAWVRSLRARGQRPRLLILHKVIPGEDAAAAERACLTFYPPHMLLNARGIFGRKKLDHRNSADMAEVAALEASR